MNNYRANFKEVMVYLFSAEHTAEAIKKARSAEEDYGVNLTTVTLLDSNYKDSSIVYRAR